MKKDQLQELDRLVARLEQHQDALQLNDTQFALRYRRHLSSYDTWTRTLKPRDRSRLTRLDKWIERLRALVAEIDGGAPVEEYYDTLPMARYAAGVYQLLQSARADRRCAVLIAPTGCGKTVTLLALRQQYPRETVYVRSNETWKDSRMRVASGLASALGSPIDRYSAGNTFKDVVEHLKARPVTLMIDEAHEGGVLLLKLVKTIIDEAGARVILSLYPTAWTRLVNGSTEAQQEAQQLLGRTIKPIAREWLRGPRPDDIAAYLTATCPQLNGATPAIAKRIHPIIRPLGLRLLADVVDAAHAWCEAKDEPLTAQLLEQIAHEQSATGITS